MAEASLRSPRLIMLKRYKLFCLVYFSGRLIDLIYYGFCSIIANRNKFFDIIFVTYFCRKVDYDS